MLIPIRDDNPTARRAWITLAIIAANVLVFGLWQQPWKPPLEQELFAFCHAEIPWEVTHQENLAQGGREAVRAIDAEHIGIDGRDLQDVLQGERGVRGVPDFHGCPHKSWWEAVVVSMFLHGGGCTSAATCCSCGCSGTTWRTRSAGSRTSRSTCSAVWWRRRPRSSPE